MGRVTLTEEQKRELSLWSIHLNYWINKNDEGSWGIRVWRGRLLMGGHGAYETLREALTAALNRDFRRDMSPVPRPIPPSQVYIPISAKYLQDNPETAERLDRFIAEESHASISDD